MCGYILFSEYLTNFIVKLPTYNVNITNFAISLTEYKIIIFWQISFQITFLSDKVKVNLALYVFVLCFNEASSSVTSFLRFS